jgi:hypothetical protein
VVRQRLYIRQRLQTPGLQRPPQVPDAATLSGALLVRKILSTIAILNVICVKKKDTISPYNMKTNE